ncbi:MFS transporter [Cuneatibacter sp. NSJ-177]|jgi:MFS family permease|uniref:MFS transporter n=1 Tax=Cuneatibacter sp. NSJ-177 TaxID=2931401 RepID=UPI001FD5ED86|nr:MFS transporter [Cuneatibacter sp. NSJ-177]MCJ7835515.1 MFS transporter [Cuneatibacter sp. NSJ-177]
MKGTEKENGISAQERLWSQDFILLCLVAVVARLAFTCQYTAIPLFVQEIGNGKAQAGMAAAVYSLTALAFRPFMGTMVDCCSRRFTMGLGVVVFTAAMGIYLFLGSSVTLGVVYLLQGVNGIAFSALTVGMTTACTDVVPLSRLTKGIGIFGLSSTIANAFAPALALHMIGSSGGYRTYFTAAGIISFAGFVGILLIRYEKRLKGGKISAPARGAEEKESRVFWEKFVERSAVFGSLMVILVMFAASSLNNFLPTLAEEYSILNISLFFTLQAVGTAVSRLGADGVSRKIGYMPALIVGYACYILGFIGIFIMFSDGLVIAMGFFCGIGQGLTQTILNMAAVIRAPQNRRGSANATFYMAMDIAIGLGGYFWGIIADVAGTRMVYLGTALVVGAVTAYTSLFHKKLDKKIFH